MIYNILLSDLDKYIDDIIKNKSIVYIKNWPYGLCSALICLLNNIDYLKKYNLNIFPYWDTNSEYFKYSENDDECFNKLFDDKNKELLNEEYKNFDIYYVKSNIPIYQNKQYTLPYDDIETIKNIKNIFNSRFSIKKSLYEKYKIL